MTKINQIENALQQMGGESFQKLADAYLHSKGYDPINSLGAVIGADKVRQGTPDMFIPLTNGKYVFAEYTTQQVSLYHKFNGDLQKCFDEEKTGVPVARIEEIVLCHTSLLDPRSDHRLRKECMDRGITLTILGANAIAQDLYRYYPGLARDFLGVSIDTGQILAPEDFVREYGNNALVTPLDTTFVFHDQDVADVLQALDDGDLVILSGRAGVGKSRLALECCRKFIERHQTYTVRCILSHGVDLFEDLQTYFMEPKPYLILVDDVNRVNHPENVLQLLHHQTDERRIKIIITVRDYALAKANEISLPYGGGRVVKLDALTDEQIRSMVQEQKGIANHLYLDRIADISRGNPRLAIMAAQVAINSNTLQSIRDVTALYHKYFVVVRQELDVFDDPTLVKAAGIVAFWRAVDRSNKQMMTEIDQIFGISGEAFWHAAGQLHDMEILDMYESEVVKVSDQVMATYFFYLATFEKQLIDISSILEHFFPKYRGRVIDALNPVVEAFNSEPLMERLRNSIAHRSASAQAEGDQYAILTLMETFGQLQPEDTLIYLQEHVDKLESDPLTVPLSWDDHYYDKSSPSVLSILAPFRHTPHDVIAIALEILMVYLDKRPSELPRALDLLTQQFGFEPASYSRGYEVQQAVVRAVWTSAHEGSNPLITDLFLRVTSNFLHTHFSSTKARGKDAVTFTDFTLPTSPELFELRGELWGRVFRLHGDPAYRASVLNLVKDYAKSRHDVAANNIIRADAEILLPFLSSALDSDKYTHCCIMRDVLRLLRKLGLEYDEVLAARFSCGTSVTADLLFDDLDERRLLDMGYDGYGQWKRQIIGERLAAYDLPDYKTFFQHCAEIKDSPIGSHDDYQLKTRVAGIFADLMAQNPDLADEVLGYYLTQGDPLDILHYFQYKQFVSMYGFQAARAILNSSNYPHKAGWLLGLYAAIPAEQITADEIEQVCALYEAADVTDVPQRMDYLLKYGTLDPSVILRVVSVILRKAKKDDRWAYALLPLFYSHTKSGQQMVRAFTDHMDILKAAYLVGTGTGRNPDYGGEVLSCILTADPSFIRDVLDCLDDSHRCSQHHLDPYDFSFLWQRDDYGVVMEDALNHLWERSQSENWNWGIEPGSLFWNRSTGTPEPMIVDRQDRFLEGIIQRRHGEDEFMRFVFDIVRDLSDDRRCRLLSWFTWQDQCFERFQQLPLTPRCAGWSGSMVPTLQAEIDSLIKLKDSLNTAALLRHRVYVVNRIQALREAIQREKKSDFMKE